MRVLAVIDSLDPGGAERSLVDSLVAMPTNVDAEIAILRHSADGFERDAAAADIPLHYVGGPFGVRVRNIRRVVEQRQPDVVHSSLWNADLATRAALLRMDTPLVCSLVNDTYSQSRAEGYSLRRRALLAAIRSIDRVTARRVDQFHAVTDSVRRHYVGAIGLDPDRVQVAWRGRDLSRFRPPSPPERDLARLALGVEGPAIVAIGRLEPQKSIPTLVDAMADILRSAPDASCLVVGREGSDGERIRTRIAELGLEPHVRLIGPRPDIEAVLAAADCLALPSTYEGTAGVVLEAMLVGVPVVASDLPGVREVTRNGNLVRLVPVGDTSALAAAVEAFIAERPEALVTEARAHATSHFSVERSARDLLNIYERAILERARR